MIPPLPRRVATSRVGLALAAALLGVACSDGGSDDPVAPDETITSFSAPAAAGDTVGTEVAEGVSLDGDIPEPVPARIVDTPIGRVYAADFDGRTLYLYYRDPPRGTRCVEGCEEAWPALQADDEYVSLDATDPFSTIRRPTGELQWTLGERPLYRFRGDAAEGDVAGDGVGGLWFAARPVPAAVEGGRLVGAGSIVTGRLSEGGYEPFAPRTDVVGRTLYTLEDDGPNESTCTGACAANFPPLYADPGSVGLAPFSIFARADGRLQYAYRGQPLYFYVGDSSPGDELGDGVEGRWSVARP